MTLTKVPMHSVTSPDLDRSSWIEEIVRRGVLALAEPLGRFVRGRDFGPCPVCGAKQRGRSDPRPPCSTFDGGAAWKCHASGCEAGGDAATLAAHVLDGQRTPGPRTRDLARELSGSLARTTSPPAFDPMTVVEAWARALEGARRELAAGKGTGLGYLAERLDGDAALALLGSGEVGVADLPGLGTCLAVPLRDLAGEILDVQYRRCGPHAFRRIAGAADAAGRPLAFASPDLLGEMAGGDVILAEGLSDSLAVRALGLPVLGLAGAQSAAPVGTALAREIAALAEEGAWGPRRIVVATHADPAGDRAALDFARAVTLALPGLNVARVPMPRKTEDKTADLAGMFATKGRDGLAQVLLADPQPVVARAEAKAPEEPDGGRRVHLVCLADVVPQQVSWLWRPYLPQGKVVVLEGDPGSGKSFLSLALGSILSRDQPFPDKDGVPSGQARLPSNVVVLACEDGLADTVRPRIDAVGGDASRVFVVTGYSVARGDKEHAVTLADIDVLAQALEKARPALVVVDPLQAYLGGDVDMHRANEVRPVLQGLAKLAESYQTTVLIIRHLSKGVGGSATYRGIGSIDIFAIARSVLLVARDDEEPVKRHMVHTKSSLAPEGPALAFTIDEQGFLRWAGTSTMTAEQALGAPPKGAASKLDEAERFLREALAKGPVAVEALKVAATGAGIGWRTIERVKEQKRLPLQAQKDGGRWLWKLEDVAEESAAA